MSEEQTPARMTEDARFGYDLTDAHDPNEARTMAMAAWALLLAGVVTFLPGLVAGIVVYAKRGSASQLWRGHFDAVIRMFWIWFWLTLIATVLIWTLIGIVVGWPLLAVAIVWTAAVGVRGLVRAIESRPA